MANEQTDPESRGLGDRLFAMFKPLLIPLTSTAAALALLLYFGFASDWMAFASTGLPRIAFSWMNSIESGVRVTLDLVSAPISGPRAAYSVLAVVAIYFLWQFRGQGWVRACARSYVAYFVAVLASLLMAGWLLWGQAAILSRVNIDPTAQATTIAQARLKPYKDAAEDKIVSPPEREYYLAMAGLKTDFHRPTVQSWSEQRESGHTVDGLGVPVHLSGSAFQRSRAAFDQLVWWVLFLCVILVMLRRWWGILADGGVMHEYLNQHWDRYRATGETLEQEQRQLPWRARWRQWTFNFKTTWQGLKSSGEGWRSVTFRVLKWPVGVLFVVAREVHHTLHCVFGGSSGRSVTAGLLLPVVKLLLLFSTVLLPFSHGALAKREIGHEVVLVSLNPLDKSDQLGVWRELSPVTLIADQSRPAETEEPRKIASDLANRIAEIVAEIERLHNGNGFGVEKRLQRKVTGCHDPALADILEAQRNVTLATLRDLLQLRPSEETRYREALIRYRQVMALGAELAVLNPRCAAPLASLWLSRPSRDVLSAAPAISEAYFGAIDTVHLGTWQRVGLLLRYPREKSNLSLLLTRKPRTPSEPGQWSLMDIGDSDIASTVVARDLVSHWDVRVSNLASKSDHDDRLALQLTQSPEALKANLQVLENRLAYSPVLGVSLTALGTQVQANLHSAPELAKRGVDFMLGMACGSTESCPTIEPSVNRPAGRESDRMRASAVTSLHLTRSPYAAQRFAEILQRDLKSYKALNETGMSACESMQAPLPTACFGSSITATGFLLQSLLLESSLLDEAQQLVDADALPPSSLRHSVEHLQDYLLRWLRDDRIGEELVATACSALGQSGGRTLKGENEEDLYFEMLDRSSRPSGACVNALSTLQLDDGRTTQWLQRLMTTHFLSRETADLFGIGLITLYERGMGDQTDFIYPLWYQCGADESTQCKFLANHLRNLDGRALRKRLMACILAEPGSVPAGLAVEVSPELASANCALGATRMDIQRFDGDHRHGEYEHAALALRAALLDDTFAGSREGVCRVLSHLRANSDRVTMLWQRRAPEPHPACDKYNNESELEEDRLDLDALLEDFGLADPAALVEALDADDLAQIFERLTPPDQMRLLETMFPDNDGEGAEPGDRNSATEPGGEPERVE